MRFLLLATLTLLGAAIAAPAFAQVPTGSAERTLLVIPTAVGELAELRINTGKKAQLRDGSYNTVYEKKTPSKGMVFLQFTMDVSVEGEPLVLRAQDLRLETGGEYPKTYPLVDWFRDLGLEAARADSLTIADQALLQLTFEVPGQNVDALTLVVASLRLGTVAEIREKIRANSGLN